MDYGYAREATSSARKALAKINRTVFLYSQMKLTSSDEAYGYSLPEKKQTVI